MTGPSKPAGPSQYGSPGLEACPRCGAVYAPPMELCPGCNAPLPERPGAMGPGTVLDGKYQIVSLLGSGGMGDVFKVRHIQLNTVRTIKVLRSSLLADEWYRNRFLREARLATQVHHTNVAIVHDFATLPNGSYYMVSEFIDGLTVRQWLKRYGPFPLGLAVDVVSQVLSGLGHCHRRGLLHRDISPDNIMISIDPEDRPVAKIIDLGIAKQIAGAAADATQTGLFMGNPKYCSPEQLGQLGEGEELDLRTDIYSMGMVLFEMVTGAGPFQSTTPHGFFIKHLTEAPPPLRQVKPDVAWPQGFEAVLLKALEKDRSRRYRTAFEFADALRPFAVDLSRGLGETFGIRFDRKGTRDSDQTDRLDLREMTPARPTAAPPPPETTDPTVRYRSQRELEEFVKKDMEEKAFTRAQADGSEAAWRAFLDHYPESSRRDEAQQLLAEARGFNEAGSLDQRDKWEAFLGSWPEGRHAQRARARLEAAKKKESEAFERAASKGSADGYREFLAAHPNSPLAADAKALLEEELEFQGAAQKDTESSWEAFLARWANGRHASAAAARFDEARRKEEEAFERAVREGTSAALRQFLEKHPDAKKRPSAESALGEAVDYETASADGSEKAWSSFIDRHPQSSRRDEATRMLADARAFREAERLDSREAWESFLAKFPQSRSRGAARKRLTAANEREAAELERATAKRSAAGYREFLAKHPASPLAAKATKLLDEQLGFDAAEAKGAAKTWDEFLGAWPSGPNAAAARKKRDEARRSEEEARRKAEEEARRKEEEVRRQEEARRKKEEEARLKAEEEARRKEEEARRQEEARLEAQEEARRREEEARRKEEEARLQAEEEARRKEREARRKEEEALRKAIEEGSSAALRRFLDDHPQAANRARAEEHLAEAVAFEAAGAEGKAGWDRFLLQHPKGAHAQAARAKLAEIETESLLARVAQHERDQNPAELEWLKRSFSASSRVGVEARQALARVRESIERQERENESWRSSEKADTEEAWRRFIETFPSSARVPAAREKLAEAEARSRRTERTRPVSPPPAGEPPQDLEPTVQIPLPPASEATARTTLRSHARPSDKTVPMKLDIERQELEREIAPGEPATRARPRAALFAVAAAAVVVLAAVFLLARKPRSAPEPRAEAPSAEAKIEKVPTAAAGASPTVAPPVQMSLLVIDALPWGQVDRAEDAGGKNWSGGAEAYTPLAVAVPPGKYSIQITNPAFPGKRLTLSAEVRPGEKAVCLGRFEAVDPKAYFQTQGWKP